MVKTKYPHFNPSKYSLNVKVASVKSGFHCKFNINYHIIWIPKYRKSILRGKVAKVLRSIIEGKCQEYGWDCLALEIMPDHIHLFVGAKPNWNPSKIVNLLKGNTSRQLRQCFPELKYLGYRYKVKQFKSLWAKGYYCGTAGHVSQEQVIRYILEQESEKTPFNYNIRKNQPQKPEVQTQQNLGGWLN